MNLTGAKKRGRRFLNPVPVRRAAFGKVVPMLREYINNKAETIPKKPMGPFKTDISNYQTPPANGLRITWMGHSSLLIEIDGKRILTDPVWSERASFLPFIGPKRFFEPPLTIEELPPLDAVLISHDHHDHLDKATLKFFAGKTTLFYCPLGIGHHLEQCGIQPNYINEMDWGDGAMIGLDCVITATPAMHFSSRNMLFQNETLWSSFVIRSAKHKIFYCANSARFDGFKEIGDAFGPFDLTILEIGAYGQLWPDIHMGPEHALNAHLELQGKMMMPIHWGTCHLGQHAWYEPVEKLITYAGETQIELFVPRPGEPTALNGELVSEWWREYM